MILGINQKLIMKIKKKIAVLMAVIMAFVVFPLNALTEDIQSIPTDIPERLQELLRDEAITFIRVYSDDGGVFFTFEGRWGTDGSFLIARANRLYSQLGYDMVRVEYFYDYPHEFFSRSPRYYYREWSRLPATEYHPARYFVGADFPRNHPIVDLLMARTEPITLTDADLLFMRWQRANPHIDITQQPTWSSSDITVRVDGVVKDIPFHANTSQLSLSVAPVLNALNLPEN